MGQVDMSDNASNPTRTSLNPPDAHAPETEGFDLQELPRVVSAAASVSDSVPARIGPYHILGSLGAGGMGEVYKAERRHPIQQTVAIKIIKLGFDSREVLARFESERQALARMDHPHIARVTDAGISETGRPYFVMEYVPGAPITKFCDDNKLSIKERLLLFMQACDAISHAHTKAIIHRDIKAANVLAYMHDDRPTVKVIDFGIAKALTGDRLTEATFNTDAGRIIGTYDSMSPEQAEGSPDIDTRTDVYSLGVLLYELLTGAKPFDDATLARAADEEIKRIIREVEPPRPSTRLSELGESATRFAERRQVKLDALTKQLRSELEWIPLKAMRKQRARRYAAVSQLVDDIRNYLDGRPLIAGPESRGYRLRKFLARKRRELLALLTLLLALALGTGVYIYSIRAERRKTQVALIEAQQQKMTAELQKAEADRRRDEAEKLRQLFADTLGSISESGDLLQAKGRLDEAESMHREVLEGRRRVLGADHPDTLASVNNMGAVLQAQGKLKDAEVLYKEALDEGRRVYGEEHPHTIALLSNYAGVLRSMGRFAEAEPLYRQALEQHRRVWGEEHPNTIMSLNNYAHVLQMFGRSVEAEPLFKQALEQSRRVWGEEHPDTIRSLNNYAVVLASLGRVAEAEPLFREALARFRRLLGDDHPNTKRLAAKHVSCLTALGRHAEAAAVRKEFGLPEPTTAPATRSTTVPTTTP
jgi:serine/threonine protein kinase